MMAPRKTSRIFLKDSPGSRQLIPDTASQRPGGRRGPDAGSEWSGRSPVGPGGWSQENKQQQLTLQTYETSPYEVRQQILTI
jgi:hypothetical protein